MYVAAKYQHPFSKQNKKILMKVNNSKTTLKFFLKVSQCSANRFGQWIAITQINNNKHLRNLAMMKEWNSGFGTMMPKSIK